MATPNPRFDQYIKTQLNNRARATNTPRHGIIQTYDHTSNTATVLLSSPHSDTIGNILKNVPCPVFMGVQGVAPEPGRPCWVVFEGDQDEHNAVITHYFNHNFRGFDYGRQYNAKSAVPMFMLGV